MDMDVCLSRYRCTRKATGFPRAGVTGALEPTNVGSGIRTLVLRKSSKHSEVLSHLSSLGLGLFFLISVLHRIKQNRGLQKEEIPEIIKDLFLLSVITTPS